MVAIVQRKEKTGGYVYGDRQRREREGRAREHREQLKTVEGEEEERISHPLLLYFFCSHDRKAMWSRGPGHRLFDRSMGFVSLLTRSAFVLSF
jgi:hypothetical protein